MQKSILNSFYTREKEKFVFRPEQTRSANYFRHVQKSTIPRLDCKKHIFNRFLLCLVNIGVHKRKSVGIVCTRLLIEISSGLFHFDAATLSGFAVFFSLDFGVKCWIEIRCGLFVDENLFDLFWKSKEERLLMGVKIRWDRLISNH